VSSTFFEPEGSFSGRLLYMQVCYSVFTCWDCCNYCNFNLSNIPAVPGGRQTERRTERPNEIKIRFLSGGATAAKPRCCGWQQQSNFLLWNLVILFKLWIKEDTHINTWHINFFLLQKKERVRIYLKFVTPNYIFS